MNLLVWKELFKQFKGSSVPSTRENGCQLQFVVLSHILSGYQSTLMSWQSNITCLEPLLLKEDSQVFIHSSTRGFLSEKCKYTGHSVPLNKQHGKYIKENDLHVISFENHHYAATFHLNLQVTILHWLNA